MLPLNIVDEMLEPHIHRPSLHGAEENNASGRDRELARCVYSFFFSKMWLLYGSLSPVGEMLVKLMTSESEKSHGSMMLRYDLEPFWMLTRISDLGRLPLDWAPLSTQGWSLSTSSRWFQQQVSPELFQVPMGCSSWHILSGINPVLHMIFTFMQMYYLFMHSRLNINKNKIIAKFGLMHLLVGSYLSN